MKVIDKDGNCQRFNLKTNVITYRKYCERTRSGSEKLQINVEEILIKQKES